MFSTSSSPGTYSAAIFSGAEPGNLALPWYAIRTRSNQEKTVAAILESKGFEPYFPTYRSVRRWSDRVVEGERSLFPGYVFCRFDALNRLPILVTPGVVSILGFGKEPVAIPDAEIAAVQSILVSGHASEPHAFLQEGRRIRVQRGSLEGLEGILLKKKSAWRLIVSVPLLQRSISVEVDCDAVAAL